MHKGSPLISVSYHTLLIRNKMRKSIKKRLLFQETQWTHNESTMEVKWPHQSSQTYQIRIHFDVFQVLDAGGVCSERWELKLPLQVELLLRCERHFRHIFFIFSLVSFSIQNSIEENYFSTYHRGFHFPSHKFTGKQFTNTFSQFSTNFRQFFNKFYTDFKTFHERTKKSDILFVEKSIRLSAELSNGTAGLSDGFVY